MNWLFKLLSNNKTVQAVALVDENGDQITSFGGGGENPEFETLKAGDITAGNYTEIEADGTIINKGDATTYDDLQVNINSLPLLGARSPERVIVANDGTSTTGQSMDFDGNTAYGTVPYYAGMDTADLTLAVWTNADTTSDNELIDRDVAGGFELYVNNGDLTFAPTGGTSVTANGVIITGATQFIVVTVRAEGSDLRCKLYVDNIAVAEQVINASLYQGNAGYMIGEWHSGGWNYDGRMDNLQTYNVILTDAQITELYNNGVGTNDLPTGITASTDLIMYFKDTLINQTTMTGATDFLNNGGALVDGLIGVTSGSFGVTALRFSKDNVNEIFFTAQLPHKYKEGSNIEPHCHFSNKTTSTGDVCWGLEYLWVNVNGMGGNTTVVESGLTVGTQGEHKAINISVLDGTGKKISSILQCRLFRDPANVLDTFTEDIYLGDFDFHFEINTQGSRTTWVK